ncbi:FMN reductase [Corticibacterium sp. UT-5YL-CI-8]|nr:FMN reductase [Tianweitania sp. UT-5YL-CI-8]
MSQKKLVGFVGSFSRPSRSRTLVETAAAHAADRFGVDSSIYDITDLGQSFGNARSLKDLDQDARKIFDAIAEADVLVVGTPTYKGSYTGLFKHAIDLIDPITLAGKPVILTATGGGDRHALIVEHQLRPLFGFFQAHSLPSAIYASDRDFADGRLVNDIIRSRVAQTVAELAPFLPGHSSPVSIAAE